MFSFIWQVSGAHQIGIAGLTVILFAVGAVPLEIQRRIVNIATDGGPYRSIALLALLYAAIALIEGATKLVLNIYRNWVSESATRWLRFNLLEIVALSSAPTSPQSEGVQLSIIVAEAEPIGSFVGDGMSQPLLQIGILITVIAYLIFLQPAMALVVAIVFLPQLFFVPVMQNAINRRVVQKTSTMREVSIAIVDAGGAFDRNGEQRERLQDVFVFNMGIYKIKFTMNFAINLMTQIGYIGILSLGGYFVVTKATEIGTVIAFLSGLSKIAAPWDDLIDWYRNLRITQVKYDLVRRVAQGIREPKSRPAVQP
ncbi:ABC transporter transmembrane domain-containing protein [Ensifer sp. 1H6]|uniref:ABC transporter transmembrane domain-containing protein n=1 Tax=Ensifer sp. 1H6 TaxID=1911585 RepID=UPI001FCBB5FE|nr:ABC transporter transmembrane domain-containing protein [Ensifer sp. 1H6]